MRISVSLCVGALALAMSVVPGRTQSGATDACRLPPRQTTTFLPTLPPTAGYDILAQVELVELVDARSPNAKAGCEPIASRIRVRVLDAIKGVKRGDSFVVDTGGASTDELVALSDLGDKAFIAGRFVIDREQRTWFVGQHAAKGR